jgi:nicotinamide-nucleotide amidase
MTPSDLDLKALAARLGVALTARGARFATAESCSGGWIAKAATDNPGSSRWFSGGVVAYGNAAKVELLGVAAAVLEANGAVSEPVVAAMADGARRRFGVEFAVAVSGVAGPDGGSAGKPVGTVCFGYALPAGTTTERREFHGDRETVRRLTVAHALKELLARLGANAGER